MKSLSFSYNTSVDTAYIIRVVGHDSSEEQAARCLESCEKVGQAAEYWDAYNGLGDTLTAPAHHSGIMKMLKVTDHYLTRGEVACALSHISLWAKCVEEDKPLIVLEHDAVMTKAYTQHMVYNSICYLGSHEQATQGWGVYPTPPHASEGPNYHFMCRAHAYAIDPAVAKNMLAHVLKYGLCSSLDMMLRADIFPIHQMGVYAHDTRIAETTILGRSKIGRTTERNDDLKV
jgi:GR25 family glycosyltransferase involved in LPS biosynthesis